MSQKPEYRGNNIKSDYIKNQATSGWLRPLYKLSKDTNDKMEKIFAIYFPSVSNRASKKTQNVQKGLKHEKMMLNFTHIRQTQILNEITLKIPIILIITELC